MDIPKVPIDDGTVTTVISAILAIIMFIAIIGVIIGGIRYTVSAGDPSQVSKAKNGIIYSLVGLVVALSAWAIVNLVLTEAGAAN